MSKYTSLSNFQIDKYYINRPDYGGCFSKDQLPNNIQNKFYVLNLDDEANSGTHWTLIYNKNPHICLYIDPFGITAPTNAVNFMKKSKKIIYYSSMQLQDISSQLCGYYCIYFADEMTNNRSFLDVLAQDFNNSQLINDEIIKKYFKNI